MNINLHIEQLVLAGIDVPRSQRDLILVSLKNELSGLLSNGGLASDYEVSSSLARVTAADIQLTQSNGPARLGRQIAHSVYGGFARE